MNKLVTPVGEKISDEIRQQLGRVGVLLGGRSSEREISLRSGEAVVAALCEAGVEAEAIDVADDIVERLCAANIDRAFIVLHGAGGEDGRIQALLEFLHIPYTGSGVQASAIGMDKLLTKRVWQGMGLPTPNYRVLDDRSDWAAVLGDLAGAVMVKPTHEGSSIGMAQVSSAEQLQDAYSAARAYDSSVIAEQLIRGGEYTVAILNDRALPPIKLETDHQFYDFEAKYLADDTRYLCPCGLPDAAVEKLQTLALQAFSAVGCKGWGRVDFMADQQGNFYLLEVNTVPGMTGHSLVPMAAKVAGINFTELVVNIILTTLVVAPEADKLGGAPE